MPTAARRRITTTVLAVHGCVAGPLVAAATDSRATAATAHDPIGAVGGSWPGSVVTSVPRPTIQRRYRTSATAGFDLTVTPPGGAHIMCVIAHDVGPGLTGVLKCFATPLGRRLGTGQLSARSPRGALTGLYGHLYTIHIHGWVTDPDMVGRHSIVVVYVGGAPAATFTTGAFARARPIGAGRNSLFDRWIAVAPGAHVACVWAVNVGLGGNSDLGCKATDTRGGAGTGPVLSPALDRSVVAEARKHIGQPYVCGATGPKRFDCSGLVKYSYAKFGFSTRRIAADQFRAARLIPATRTVPGDLVVYSDNESGVYHVGVYTRPGMSVAAIDRQEGVDWQRVWPSATTYYGSFTHL